MIRPIPLLAAFCCLAIAPLANAQNERALKALEIWSRSYFSGKLDLTKFPITKSSSAAVKVGLIPAKAVQQLTHMRELQTILKAAVRGSGEQLPEMVLRLAAVGIDPGAKYGKDMLPNLVRQEAEGALDKLKQKEFEFVVEQALSSASKGHDAAMRAAALLGLARVGHGQFHVAFLAAIKEKEAFLRLAAVEGAGFAKDKTVLRELSERLDRESDGAVLTSALDASLKVVEKFREELNPELLKQIADGARNAVGRIDWRADLAACEILIHLRAAASVPVLIAILERWNDADGETDLMSGTLRNRAYEVLKSLTGATVPMEDGAAWRTWWEGARDAFEVREVKNDEAGSDPGRTSTGDFFGIPVRGSRVLFVVDVSGSMSLPMRLKGRPTTGRDLTDGMLKIELAKRELLKAVESLTADSKFNCVNFSNEAEGWRKNMVEAKPKVKKVFTKWVDKLRADGGTNLWQGIADGLKFQNIGFGDQYGENYDEMFILSDGLPSVGDVQDPKQILRLIAETNRWSKLRINTVYISGDPKQEQRAAEIVGMSGKDFMKKIAEQNGGTAVAF